jgi:uncharacterized repeat protein (TIGR04076 family)
MKRKKHSQKNQSFLKGRRDFCKMASFAAAGLFVAERQGEPLYGEIEEVFSNRREVEEVEMAKKITSVVVKVKSQKGSCAIGHNVGDIVKITESGIDGKICIHALYSMLPAVFAMMFEARFPWLKDPDIKTHACPDAVNPVVFEITRVRE